MENEWTVPHLHMCQIRPIELGGDLMAFDWLFCVVSVFVSCFLSLIFREALPARESFRQRSIAALLLFHATYNRTVIEIYKNILPA